MLEEMLLSFCCTVSTCKRYSCLYPYNPRASCPLCIMLIRQPLCLQILFNKDNVEDVLRISDRLQVIPVKDACAIWLEKEMDAFNVLEILLL